MLHLVSVNLLRNPRRAILTTLAIALSIFVLSVLLSLPAIADRILADRASSLRLICHSRAGMLYSLPEAYRRKIEGHRGVQAVAAFTFFLGIYHEPTDQFPNAAVDHEQIEVIWPDWGISPAAAQEFKRLRIACLVGPALNGALSLARRSANYASWDYLSGKPYLSDRGRTRRESASANPSLSRDYL